MTTPSENHDPERDPFTDPVVDPTTGRLGESDGTDGHGSDGVGSPNAESAEDAQQDFGAQPGQGASQDRPQAYPETPASEPGTAGAQPYPGPDHGQLYGTPPNGSQNYGGPGDGQQYGSQPFGSEQYGAQPYGSQQYGAQQYGAPQYGAQPYGSQQYGSQQYGAQQYGAQPYGTPQYGAQPYGQPYGAMQPYGQASSVARKDPALMLVASLIIPGLGTILNGETGKGIGILAGYLTGIPLTFILIGIPMMLGFWIWGMIDAYQGAQNHNARHGLP